MVALDPIPPKVKECLGGLTPARQVILRSYIASLRVDWKEKEEELEELQVLLRSKNEGEASCQSTKCTKGCCGNDNDGGDVEATKPETAPSSSLLCSKNRNRNRNRYHNNGDSDSAAANTNPTPCETGRGKGGGCGGKGGGGSSETKAKPKPKTDTTASAPSSESSSGCSTGCCG
eukprot:jgi/Psemu1/16158/gm1.16158_g